MIREQLQFVSIKRGYDVMLKCYCYYDGNVIFMQVKCVAQQLGTSHNHDILLVRLHDIGVRRTALEWFKSYLDGRTFTVKIGQTMSARSEVRCGVPQGSVLGPMLFNVYCLPIRDIFAKYNVRYHIYADDTQLFVKCQPNDHTDALRQITECVEDLRRWLTDNGLLLNEDTTEEDGPLPFILSG